jgi:hypothetical protein
MTYKLVLDIIGCCTDSCSRLFSHFIRFVPAITKYITLIKNTNKKSMSKYSQVGSCCEVFIVINSIVQSEFNFDTRFMIYRFFLIFKQFGDNNFFLSVLHACKILRWSACAETFISLSTLPNQTYISNHAQAATFSDKLFFSPKWRLEASPFGSAFVHPPLLNIWHYWFFTPTLTINIYWIIKL